MLSYCPTFPYLTLKDYKFLSNKHNREFWRRHANIMLINMGFFLSFFQSYDLYIQSISYAIMQSFSSVVIVVIGRCCVEWFSNVCGNVFKTWPLLWFSVPAFRHHLKVAVKMILKKRISYRILHIFSLRKISKTYKSLANSGLFILCPIFTRACNSLLRIPGYGVSPTAKTLFTLNLYT